MQKNRIKQTKIFEKTIKNVKKLILTRNNDLNWDETGKNLDLLVSPLKLTDKSLKSLTKQKNFSPMHQNNAGARDVFL